ncbi:hypothetical protein C8J56DRAFT_941605 [Mycena floridula]|nr:hypothetical protein C8J56DRAFT_941605 [Mycena floridula]
MAPPIPRFIHQQFPDFVKEYKRQKQDFLANAVEEMFSTSFGEIKRNLDAWCNLCKTIGVATDLPLGSIKACKAALRGKFVDLVDLVQAASADRVMEKTFPTLNDLAEYIHLTGKFYLLHRAKNNPLLEQFLIIKGGSGKKVNEEKK